MHRACDTTRHRFEPHDKLAVLVAEVVSEVMGRTLIRMPMGGVDDVFLIGADQAYNRGRHGEIARRIRESGRHPSELVFLLDEIDKVPDKTNSECPCCWHCWTVSSRRALS
jgi:hypothetical protein